MFPQPRILAQATVDPGEFEVMDRIHDQPFDVTVNGRVEGGKELPKRLYHIAAVDEPHAAFHGIALYEHEFRRVN